MPELPEVESVRQMLQRELGGRSLVGAEAVEDPIVWQGAEPRAIEAELTGKTVLRAGRKGKFGWLELNDGLALLFHLGMSGWVRRLASAERRLVSHGNAPLDDAEGRPRFLKLSLEADSGVRIAFTDGRRLGRIWLSDDPESDRRIAALGPDALDELPSLAELRKRAARRSGPVKGLLLDQSFLAGIGNWVADEVLREAGIAPAKPVGELSARAWSRLREAVRDVLRTAVEADADPERFPAHWLFHVRWGRSPVAPDGRALRRETIAGRATVWAPTVQR